MFERTHYRLVRTVPYLGFRIELRRGVALYIGFVLDADGQTIYRTKLRDNAVDVVENAKAFVDFRLAEE